MDPAQKRKPIGFIKPDEKDEKKPGTGNRKPGTDILGPEGPQLGLMRIRLDPGVFRSVTGSNFVKVRLKSDDGRFALDMILKDSESHLQLVPRRMPAISLHMEPGEISDLESRTIVMFEDGMGNTRGYAIATLRQVEQINNGWVNKKHFLS